MKNKVITPSKNAAPRRAAPRRAAPRRAARGGPPPRPLATPLCPTFYQSWYSTRPHRGRLL